MTLEEQIDQQAVYAGNYFIFAKDVLGYTDMLPEHESLCAFLQQSGSLKLVLMPRYSFKSCLCTIGYTLWRLVREDSLRVLIYSDTSTKAENFLTSIKNHILGLEKGSRFREVYGDWETDPKRGVWNQSQIIVRPRQSAHAEPSVDTGGIETSKVGLHYDLIVFDDIVSDANVTTPEQMQKVKECYRKALSLLKPGGDVLLTGTRWHFGDLYGQLVADPPHGLQTFIRKAEADGVYPFAKIKLTREFCEQQKKLQGSYYFSALYQNDPTDDETAMFKVKNFRFYQPIRNEAFEKWVAELDVTCVLDAIPPPSSNHGDDASITVVGTDNQWNLYLLDAFAGRIDPDEQLDRVFQLFDQWNFRVFGLETNVFQKMLRKSLEQRMQEARTKGRKPFSVEEFTGSTQGNKERRIQGLQPYHERGALFIPGERIETLKGVYYKLVFQMQQFPNSAHDDVVDSLAYHLQLNRRGKANQPPKVEYPYSSAAWFEREQRKTDIKEMARRPRWQRRPLPELAFS